jgi:hypothetical protein
MVAIERPDSSGKVEQGFGSNDITPKLHCFLVTSTAKPESTVGNSTLLELPLDIIMVIFDYLSACMSACLGLT